MNVKLQDAVAMRAAAMRRMERSRRTIDWYLMWLNNLMRSLPIEELAAISLHHLRRWVDGLVERQLSVNTRRGAVTAIKVFFKWCVAEGLLGEDPSARLEKPKRPKRIPKSLSSKDILLLIDAARRSKNPERDTALVMFMTETGLRRAELLDLVLDDVKLGVRQQDGGLVFVKEGKGDKDRFVPFGEVVYEALSKWLVVRRPDTTTLFGLRYHGLPSLLSRLAKRAGVTARVTPHAFRHTSATMRAEVCGSTDLMQLFGWSDIRMAEIYVSWAQDKLRARGLATSPMDRLFKETALPSSGHQSLDWDVGTNDGADGNQGSGISVEISSSRATQ